MKKPIDRRQFGRQVGLGALAASTALVAGRPRPAQAAPTRIRVGWVVVPASSAPLVLEKKELLTNFGKSYVAEAIHFEGTPPVISALAAGELKIGPLAFSSFALAIANAHMDDLHAICDEIQDGVPSHGSDEFVVLTALQSNLQLQKQVGLLNADIDVKKYADLSMVEEAAKRLG